MQLFDELRPYWPVVAASLLFCILGLLWRILAARAMERSPKSIEWVRRYRTGGFPFRQKLMGTPKLRLWALLAVLLAACALAFGRLANVGFIRAGGFGSLELGKDWILTLSLSALGGAAVYCLLTVLFEGLWVALPGALLFAASAANCHGENSLLALSLLLLLLYLRAGKPGFPAELLYLGSILALAPAIALRPAFLWLLPCWPPVHWYKLIHQLRSRRLPGMKLLLALVFGLLTLALSYGLAAILHPVLAKGGYLFPFDFSKVLPALRDLLREAAGSFYYPSLPAAADLMVDAPLLGFGIWGCCSAWILARKRRDARGYFVLTVLAAQLLLWFSTWRCVPTLGLTLSAACILRDANLGKQRFFPLLMTLAGIAWYIFIHTAAWALPLSGLLRERLI